MNPSGWTLPVLFLVASFTASAAQRVGIREPIDRCNFSRDEPYLIDVPETFIRDSRVQLLEDGSIEAVVQLEGPQSSTCCRR